MQLSLSKSKCKTQHEATPSDSKWASSDTSAGTPARVCRLSKASAHRMARGRRPCWAGTRPEVLEPSACAESDFVALGLAGLLVPGLPGAPPRRPGSRRPAGTTRSSAPTGASCRSAPKLCPARSRSSARKPRKLRKLRKPIAPQPRSPEAPKPRSPWRVARTPPCCCQAAGAAGEGKASEFLGSRSWGLGCGVWGPIAVPGSKHHHPGWLAPQRLRLWRLRPALAVQGLGSRAQGLGLDFRGVPQGYGPIPHWLAAQGRALCRRSLVLRTRPCPHALERSPPHASCNSMSC